MKTQWRWLRGGVDRESGGEGKVEREWIRVDGELYRVERKVGKSSRCTKWMMS